MLGKN